MQRIFSAHELPTDLSYLPILESGYNPFAYSYAHASGIWQFIPSTGARFGLRNNFWIDERRDPFKSTGAAIQYFKRLYERFRDWHLVLAAYNCGEMRVERAINTAQSRNFWDLTLPSQTMNYVPQFIAYQLLIKNPGCFGIDQLVNDTFNLDTVNISLGLDLRSIAERLAMPFQFLKNMNPHLRYHCTPPAMDNVTLYLPRGYAPQFKEIYRNLTDRDKVVLFRYRIRGGDNLYRISQRFNIPVTTIMGVNNLRNNYIVAGRYLYIPLSLSETPSRRPDLSGMRSHDTAG
jgi:membrane-bound lytic murein transglycosylase D